MDAVRRTAFWLYQKAPSRYVPWRFLRSYVYPLTVRGRKRAVQADRFYESYYRAVAHLELSDGITIAPGIRPLQSQYHYNAVENSILRHFAREPLGDHPTVLDIGSGAGHWIDFYRRVFDASLVCGVEISETCANALRHKYTDANDVVIVEGDISDESFSLDRRFDVINAIGVVFHIVEDDRWRQALANMRGLLEEGGVLLVGGEFGWITQNVQFHSRDEFANLAELLEPPRGGEIYVNKRIRSLRYWKRVASQVGLRVRRVVRTSRSGEILTPENNVLVLVR